MENVIIKDIITSKIVRHNCEGLCSEESCSEKTSHFFEIKINNFNFLIAVCEKHSEMIDNSYFEKCTEPPVIECLLDGVHWKFYCEYCGEYHLHGIGEGHRLSHCVEDSPYKETGYVLKLKESTNATN